MLVHHAPRRAERTRQLRPHSSVPRLVLWFFVALSVLLSVPTFVHAQPSPGQLTPPGAGGRGLPSRGASGPEDLPALRSREGPGHDHSQDRRRGEPPYHQERHPHLSQAARGSALLSRDAESRRSRALELRLLRGHRGRSRAQTQDEVTPENLGEANAPACAEVVVRPATTELDDEDLGDIVSAEVKGGQDASTIAASSSQRFRRSATSMRRMATSSPKRTSEVQPRKNNEVIVQASRSRSTSQGDAFGAHDLHRQPLRTPRKSCGRPDDHGRKRACSPSAPVARSDRTPSSATCSW